MGTLRAMPETISPAASTVSIDALAARLNALCDEQPFTTGWFFKDLRSGARADRAGEVVVPSASTRKIAILVTALKQVHDGILALDQPVTIQARYQDNQSGCFQHLQPGFTIQLRDALVMMIIVSDNTSTGTVADLVGLDTVNALCQSVGMRGTTHRHGIPPVLGYAHPVDATNATTPADTGLLLELILRGSEDATAAARIGCTPELCQLALDILSWQKLRGRLPFLLPVGTKVAHKTGTGARGYHDAGIVFANQRPLFILTAYTDQVRVETPDGTPGPAAAALLIARLGRTCWDQLL
jgi:beta-lactamase class A